MILVVTTLITGCYKSILTNTTHPDYGKVEVKVVLPSVDPDATIPNGYTLILNGEEIAIDEDGTEVLPETLEPGTYTVYVYSDTSEMNIENNINESGKGTITSSKIVDAGMVNSLTEDLYFGTQSITVLADQIIASEVHLSQVTRTIKFNLLLSEGDIDKIESISTTLSGIAQQWECVEDIPIGDAAEIYVEFTQGESLTKADESNSYITDTIKILGVIGDEQILKLKFTFTNGNTQSITSDVSDQLAGSNDTKSTPITLSGELKIYTEFNSTGTITGWEVSDNDYNFDTNQPNE